jgi:hypothetical protein
MAEAIDPHARRAPRSSRPTSRASSIRIRAKNFLKWGTCAGPTDVRGKDADCSSSLKYGMKRDFNAWLASLGDRARQA